MLAYHLTDTLSMEANQFGQHKITTQIFIQANEFSKAQGKENYQWKVIDGLGYSKSGIILFPFKNHIFNNEKPYLEYTFDIEKTGTYQLEIRCLPTHSNDFEHKIWIDVNDKEIKEFSINTKGRSDLWNESVLRNFASITCPIIIDNTRK